MEAVRTCKKCRETKPLTEYPKNRLDPSGRGYPCRACGTAQNRAWRRANRDKVAEANAKNKITKALWTIQKRKENPEYGKEAQRDWAKRNPDKVAARAKRRNDRLALLSGGVFDPRREDYRPVWVLFGGRCGYCLVEAAVELDHWVPTTAPDSSNAPENLVPACRGCNASRAARSHTDWILFLVTVRPDHPLVTLLSENRHPLFCVA